MEIFLALCIFVPDMIKFEHSSALYLLFILIPLSLAFGLFVYQRRKSLKTMGDSRVWPWLMPLYPRFKHQLKFILLMLSIASLILALANPQLGRKTETINRTGVDVMLALDISQSMRAEDETPNRLEKAKQYISRLLNRLTGDRVGLIVFAGNAYMQVPLTSDYAVFKSILSSVSTDFAPTQGTAIGEAIRMADASFDSGDPKHKAIIVISDGETHEGEAETAAQEVAEKGVIIHALGVGTAEGSPIPVGRKGREQGFKRDQNGGIVLSKLNETMLRKISVQANGEYYQLSGGSGLVQAMINQLSQMEQNEYEEQVFTDFEDQYQWFLLLAILFLTVEYFISERKSKWFSDWLIFRE